jgi:hypothetical protein
MNGENGRFLRFPQIGTPPAMLRASPMTGQEKHQGSGNKVMNANVNANAAYYRNAFFAVAFSVVAGLVFMAGAVGPAVVIA